MTQRGCALLIGSSNYKDIRLSTLTSPNADLDAMASVLKDSKIGKFDTVSLLHNKSKHETEVEIEKFFNQRKSTDLVLLYFSGHGYTDLDGELYFALANSNLDVTRSTMIPANFIRTEMEHCRAKQQLAILDCCHSGAFKGTKSATWRNVNTESHLGGSGRVIVTASAATQHAIDGAQIEGKATPSVFTKYFYEGLKTGKADLDNDGEITINELYAYTYRLVKTDPLTEQEPMLMGSQKGSIIIGWNINHEKNNSIPTVNLNKQPNRASHTIAREHQNYIPAKPPLAQQTFKKKGVYAPTGTSTRRANVYGTIAIIVFFICIKLGSLLGKMIVSSTLNPTFINIGIPILFALPIAIIIGIATNSPKDGSEGFLNFLGVFIVGVFLGWVGMHIFTGTVNLFNKWFEVLTSGAIVGSLLCGIPIGVVLALVVGAFGFTK